MATTSYAHQDFNQARAELAGKIGEVAWQLPMNIVIGMLNQILGLGLGYATAKSGMGADVGLEAGKNLIPSAPVGESTEAAINFITPAIEVLDYLPKRAGEITEDFTGSKYAGEVAHLASSFALPTAAIKGITALKGIERLKPPRATGESVGKHVDIDLRARDDVLSRGIGTVGTAVGKVISGGKVKKVVPDYYGTGKYDRPAAVLESSIRAAGSVVKSILNPKADAILKQHGLAPASIKRINEYRDLLNRRDNPSAWADYRPPTAGQILHAEKILIAELRKAFGMRIKSGKKVSPELARVVEQYHPRLVKADGVPTVDQMRQVLGTNIPEQYLAPLIDDMARTMRGDRPNIIAFDGNPEKVAMTGVGKKGRITSENTTEIFTLPKSSYDMMGELWANLMAGNRFNPELKSISAKSWVKPGDKRYNDLADRFPDQGFNQKTIDQYFSIKADMARYQIKSKGAYNTNIYSEGLGPKMIDIDGQGFLIYRVVSQSDNPLLANMPATILFNPRTGVSRILSYDELDILSGSLKAITEVGYANRFHTVNFGRYIYDDAKLKKAGVGKKAAADKPEVTIHDRAAREANIDAILDTPYAGEVMQRGFLPITREGIEITTDQLRKKKDANSQTRNIY